jgi:hypothetical protein
VILCQLGNFCNLNLTYEEMKYPKEIQHFGLLFS